jgi:hypothetical protein
MTDAHGIKIDFSFDTLIQEFTDMALL